MSAATTDVWLPGPRNASDALPLLCLPHAGAGASAYRDWAERLAPSGIAPRAVQPPGRETRMEEEPYRDVRRLAADLAAALRPTLRKPYALYGHSMGALIVFELARALRRAGARPPVHLFVSGRGAPQLPQGKAALHRLPDEKFLPALRSLGGMPEHVDAYPELVAMHLPLLRADLELNEAYCYSDEPPLDVPLTAFGGREDPVVPEEALRAWSEQTSARFAGRMLPGGHFLTGSSAASMLRALAADVSISLADCPTDRTARGGRPART